jgi:glycosyltransferase involved in cell wall biosynthesis
VHLAKRGDEVWVLTGEPVADHSRRIAESAGMQNLHILELPIPRPWRLLQRGHLGVYMHYFLWLRQSYKVGRKLCASQQFEVAHHVSWGSIFFGSPLWRLGIPFVLGPVGGGQTTPRSLVGYLRNHGRSELLRSLLVRVGTPLNPLARRAVKNAAVVLATNSDTQRQAMELGARTVRLVPDTAVPPTFAGQSRERACSSDSISILWLARLLPRKGLPLALDALSRITSGVTWTCLIVGDGPLSGEIPDWLNEFEISDRARWVGRLPWTEIARAYEQADVFLFTSLRDSLGSQLYEAAAFGLPIVGLDHQGMADLIPDDMCVKVPVGDSDQTATAVARAIEDLARDSTKCRAMSEAALRFAQRNTWVARVEETYSIIESSLEEMTAR